MHVKKRIFAFLFAALAMALLTACGKWDYSREAMKAANGAQGENVRVTFEIDQKFTSSLRGAAEDNIQPADVKNAMAMDKTIEKLLTAGYRLDIYALRADTDAAKAAAQLADEFVSRLAGCEEKGYISMVKADNGYFYEAVLVYRHGGNGGASDSGEPAKTITGGTIIGVPTNKEYNVGDPFKPAGLQIELTYSDGSTEKIELTNSNSSCTDKMRGCKKSVDITYEGEEYTYTLPGTVTVNPTIDKNDYGKSALLTQDEFDALRQILENKAKEADKELGSNKTVMETVAEAVEGKNTPDGIHNAIRDALNDLPKITTIGRLEQKKPNEYQGNCFDETKKHLNGIDLRDRKYSMCNKVYMYVADSNVDGNCTVACYVYLTNENTQG